MNQQAGPVRDPLGCGGGVEGAQGGQDLGAVEGRAEEDEAAGPLGDGRQERRGIGDADDLDVGHGVEGGSQPPVEVPIA